MLVYVVMTNYQFKFFPYFRFKLAKFGHASSERYFKMRVNEFCLVLRLENRPQKDGEKFRRTAYH